MPKLPINYAIQQIDQKPVELEEFFSKTIANIRTTKFRYFGNTLALFDFFVYANLNTVAPQPLWLYTAMGHDYTMEAQHSRQPLFKMDSVIEHVSASATSSYLSAMLPKEIDSISVKLPPPDEELNSDVSQAIKDSNVVTKKFRKFIRKSLPRFMNTIQRLVRDYIDYGNCVCLWDEELFELKYIPFKHAFFWGGGTSKSFFFMYESGLLPHEYLVNYPQDTQEPCLTGTITEITVQHVFTNDLSLLNEKVEDHTQYHGYLNSGGILQLDVSPKTKKILKVREWGYNPIFQAKNNTIAGTYAGSGTGLAGDNLEQNMLASPITFANSHASINRAHIYGRGAGIQAISSIMQANFALQMNNMGTLLSIHPSCLASKGTTVNKGTEDENQLIIRPGKVNTVDESIAVGGVAGSGHFDILSKPEQVVGVFAENYALHIKQIETAYNTEIFSLMSAPNQTATEVIERQAASARQFRGMASPFYEELLLPLLHRLYSIFTSNDPELAKREYEIEIFSFEDEQYREIKTAKLERYVANLVQLASIGVEIPDIQKKIVDTLKETEENYLHN